MREAPKRDHIEHLSIFLDRINGIIQMFIFSRIPDKSAKSHFRFSGKKGRGCVFLPFFRKGKKILNIVLIRLADKSCLIYYLSFFA
jgi:hypothetical protein